MSKSVRVRFAPSPTGPLHIGGLRTALFNYLFAKKHGGTFILRVEDTDQSRFVNGAEDYIIEALDWCGISFDEGPGKEGSYGPYRQSDRKVLYEKYATQLVKEGKAYYAFDTQEQLDTHRKQHEEKGKTFIYNWHNREKGRLVNSLVLSQKETEKRIASGEDYVIRFKSPENTIIELHDLVRGPISIDSNTLDDKILFKNDGMPTYHLANIVDDHLMEISHVIRGEEWLPSLALHKLMYDAFKWEAPQFAHLPLILNPTGKGKLSKRHASKLGIPVFPLEWTNPDTKEIALGFREEGFFPEAVVNFLALLGWNPGTEQEIFSLEELINSFDLNKVQKGSARFDPDKTKWFNHHYMQEQSNLTLAKDFKARQMELREIDINYIALAVGLIKERASFVNEFWDLSHFLFSAPKYYDEKALKKAIKPETSEYLEKVVSIITATREFTVENLQAKIKGWISEQGIGFGKVMMPLRLALVGELKGPDVFEIMFMIGKNETVQRINRLIQQNNHK